MKESRGREVRAFAVGNRVVAAMRRVAPGDVRPRFGKTLTLKSLAPRPEARRRAPESKAPTV